MIGNDAPLFGRLITAMVTPFDDGNHLDLPAIDRLVDHLLSSGSESLVIAGTTGEGPTLNSAEKRELLARVVKRCAGSAKVIMGTGTNSTDTTIKASTEAMELGADGVLVVAPYYNKPGQSGLIAHFSKIAETVNLPLVIYNIPGRTGINITRETVITLSRSYSNIHALKDSTGNTDETAEIAGFAPADFRIYSGDDYLTLPFLAVGSCGVISVASHLIGGEIQQMIGHFLAGRLDEARGLHYQWLPLFKGLFAATNPTCVKYALSTLGLCKNNLRLPLLPLDQDQQTAMNILLNRANISAAAASR